MKPIHSIHSSIAAALLACAGSGCSGAPPPRPVEIPVPVESVPQGLDRAPALAIDNPAYARAIEYSARRGGLALVVIDADRVALAIGQNGAHFDEPQPLHGASEGFWGPLAVAAERDGLLELDERVSSAIQEWDDVRWKEDVRVRHLLAYTSGLEAGVLPLLRDDPVNRYERALALEMIAAPGERFQVGPSHLAVFGEFLRRRFAPQGLDALAYLERRILAPIGVAIGDWERDPAGNPDLASGAHMTAYDWAKFGVLIRDRGRWREQVVLDEDGVETCLEPGELQPRFGLGFWLDAARSGSSNPRARAEARSDAAREQPEAEPADLDERPGDVAMAAGAGNQRLYIIPSWQLVVARFGRDDRDWRDPDFVAEILAGASADRQALRDQSANSEPNHDTLIASP
ncbi:MAG TPA: serine hydrolase [Myxococcota bacterium]|nr:serine hydrolase [Myxococcota bacterium]